MTDQPKGDSTVTRQAICAVIFDMDGLLIDSEVYWERARRAYSSTLGCRWTEADERDAKGMNSAEWATLIQQRCHLEGSRDAIIRGVAESMRQLYQEHLPLLPGAESVVQLLSARYPLGLASSSPPFLIEYVLDRAHLRSCFSVIVSSDEVGKGKPAPDVFLVTAQRLHCPPRQVVVFEDSTAGIAAAQNADMYVIAVPNPHYPPSAAALSQASLVLPSLQAFHLDMVGQLGSKQ